MEAGQQPLMTEIPALAPSHNHVGPTTLLQRRPGHCYQLHRPHLSQQDSKKPGHCNSADVHQILQDPQDPGEQHALLNDEDLAASDQSALATLTHHRQVAVDHRHHHHHGHHHHHHGNHQNKLRVKPIQRLQQYHSSSTDVSNLYPEILALIFTYLNVRDKGRAAQVCTSWRDAAYHKSVWRGVEARLHLRKHSPILFSSLVRRGVKRIQVLSLRRGLNDVFRCIPSLESLNLSGCYNIADSGLSYALCQNFPSLVELNLSLCKQITDLSLEKIAQTLKNLESLELGGCCNVTNAGLLYISWGLKKLKRLDLRSCWQITDQGIGHLAGLYHSQIGGNLALEHLGLQDCQRLSDESLRHVSTGLGQSLKSINLSFCVSITDSGMKHLAKIGSLRDLDLRACDNVTEIGMAYLAEGGSKISSLDISFCDKISDQALVHISQGLFNLRSLSLSACEISDEGICRIAKTLQELETLHIGQCSRLTDKSIASIADSMRHLKCIDLYGCVRISTSAIERIMKLPELTTLNLGLWHVR